MKRFLRLWGLLFLLAPAAAEARPDIYGFTLPSWWHDSYSGAGADQSLTDMAQTGAKWVSLIPTWYMKTGQSESFAPTEQSASDDSLLHIIRLSRAMGMHVVLKPHVNCSDGTEGSHIKPIDAGPWFENYRDFILHYARMAQAEKVELLVVGTELTAMAGSDHRGQWEDIIRQVRSVYSGKITYAAHFYDFMSVPFWGSLDYIGVDGYFPLLGGSSVTLLKIGWLPYRLALKDFSAAYGKPLLFTEIGISAQKGANRKPWAYNDFGPVDMETQKAYFEAFLDMFADEPYFAGFLQWCWDLNPNAGGPGDKSMTVQGKTALDFLKSYFRSLNSPAPAPAARELGLDKAGLRALAVIDPTLLPIPGR